jgi:hypothetical protein
MSKVQLAGNASGTGIFTIASPNSNTDRTLTLPDNTGTLLTNASTLATANLPAGTVLQVQYTNSTTRTSSTTQTTQTEISTAYRVSITPIRSNSLIVLSYFVPMGSNGSWSQNWLVDYSAVRMPAGSALNTNISFISATGSSNGARKRLAGSAMRSSNGYDLNDQLTWSMTTLDLPGTTSALQYGFTWGGEGGGAVIFGQTTSNDGAWAYDANIVIIATEVAQ